MTETPEEPQGSGTSRTWLSWLVPAALVLLIASLLGTAGVLHSRWGRETDPGMLVAARTQAKNFVSLDYRHADTDVARVLALATGKFKREYGASRKQLVAGIIEKKLVVTGSIPRNGAAVSLVDDDHGEVLVAVDLTTTTSNGATSENRYRLRVVLERVGGRWLVSDLNQVG